MKMIIGNVNMGPSCSYDPSLCASTEGWEAGAHKAKLSGTVLSVQGTWAQSFLIANVSCLQSPGVLPRGYLPNYQKSCF